eukprot:CAMPEP_0176035530 /NCGR_PEP_ID=MMETSP0120_2-20121206/17582_1 /TAXON_ID=160619 /ORGANISM="Kryptoperidinium foliaceum, Strain CCMP 1326" /LENGTH=90 /DNA_ID=CAMNT_0017368897 /DNA_START=62 /DNA_END=334 /DNA_ORIENTATION=+
MPGIYSKAISSAHRMKQLKGLTLSRTSSSVSSSRRSNSQSSSQGRHFPSDSRRGSIAATSYTSQSSSSMSGAGEESYSDEWGHFVDINPV